MHPYNQQLIIKDMEVAILEKRLKVEKKMFDSVAHHNEADASHGEAEYEKHKAKTKKLDEVALSLELDNKGFFC